jgi:hypothetical protein
MCSWEKRHVESKSLQENQELKSTNRTMDDYASQILEMIYLYLTDKVLKIQKTCVFFMVVTQKG